MAKDGELFKTFKNTTSLQDAVGLFLENSEFVGSDPYYRDINDALWEMLERCYETDLEYEMSTSGHV